jgi:hypothetical protein
VARKSTPGVVYPSAWRESTARLDGVGQKSVGTAVSVDSVSELREALRRDGR